MTGASVNKHKKYNVTKSPFTATKCKSWPYVTEGGAFLGAVFTVNAKRPSGNTQEDVVSAVIFNN